MTAKIRPPSSVPPGTALAAHLMSENNTPRKHQWRDIAACNSYDPNLFFPNDDGTAKRALAVCQDCPLSAVKACATAAIEQEEMYGVWAGIRLNRMKRERDLRRLRAIAAGDTTQTQGAPAA